MKAATVKELKQELKHCSQEELVGLCLKLSKFKKDNKELLTYLLYEASNEEEYIASVKQHIEDEFEEINTSNYYLINKSSRKILRSVKKYIRYSQKKETEVELLISFCTALGNVKPSFNRSTKLTSLYQGQLAMARKAIEKLHEDLQYDYEEMINEI
ncbi:MAG: hypothetical protein AB8B61_07875 [Cyclobacteriaceae bacterium]